MNLRSTRACLLRRRCHLELFLLLLPRFRVIARCRRFRVHLSRPFTMEQLSFRLWAPLQLTLHRMCQAQARGLTLVAGSSTVLTLMQGCTSHLRNQATALTALQPLGARLQLHDRSGPGQPVPQFSISTWAAMERYSRLTRTA